jgi:hypothetical protein
MLFRPMRGGEYLPRRLSAAEIWRRNVVERTGDRGFGGAGITLGGVLVIVGIVIGIFWSWLLGIIVALVGLVAFGGFARGRWY